MRRPYLLIPPVIGLPPTRPCRGKETFRGCLPMDTVLRGHCVRRIQAPMRGIGVSGSRIARWSRDRPNLHRPHRAGALRI